MATLLVNDESPITLAERLSLEGHDRQQEGPSVLAAVIDASAYRQIWLRQHTPRQ